MKKENKVEINIPEDDGSVKDSRLRAIAARKNFIELFEKYQGIVGNIEKSIENGVFDHATVYKLSGDFFDAITDIISNADAVLLNLLSILQFYLNRVGAKFS